MRERGFSLVGAMAGIAIMSIMMTAAVPSWRYVMRDMREEELIFRGAQIADAIHRYQQKHRVPPNSIEDLVKEKFLRRPWKDPMSQDGEWRLIRPGEPVTMGVPGLGGRPGGGRGLRMRPPSDGGGLGQPGGIDRPGSRRQGGGFVGVATLVEGESLRVVNGRTRYEEWIFLAGQKPVVGPLKKFGAAPGAGGVPGMDLGGGGGLGGAAPGGATPAGGGPGRNKQGPGSSPPPPQ